MADEKNTMESIGKQIKLNGVKYQDVETALKVLNALSERVGTSDKSTETKVILSDIFVRASDTDRAKMISDARAIDSKKLVQVISLSASNGITSTIKMLTIAMQTADKTETKK